MLEAIAICEQLTGRPMNWSYAEDNRVGDHIWWVSDVRKFQSHYPDWRYRYDLEGLIGEIHAALDDRCPERKGGGGVRSTSARHWRRTT